MKNLFVHFLVLIFLNNCVGIGIMYPKKKECIPSKNSYNGMIGCKALKSKKETISKQYVISKYGRPKKLKKQNGDYELLTYKRRESGKGLKFI